MPPQIDLDQNQEAELLRLQRLTAQRADQLAAGSGPVDDLAIWLRAEAEVFGASPNASG